MFVLGRVWLWNKERRTMVNHQDIISRLTTRYNCWSVDHHIVTKFIFQKRFQKISLLKVCLGLSFNTGYFCLLGTECAIRVKYRSLRAYFWMERPLPDSSYWFKEFRNWNDKCVFCVVSWALGSQQRAWNKERGVWWLGSSWPSENCS